MDAVLSVCQRPGDATVTVRTLVSSASHSSKDGVTDMSVMGFGLAPCRNDTDRLRLPFTLMFTIAVRSVFRMFADERLMLTVPLPLPLLLLSVTQSASDVTLQDALLVTVTVLLSVASWFQYIEDGDTLRVFDTAVCTRWR